VNEHNDLIETESLEEREGLQPSPDSVRKNKKLRRRKPGDLGQLRAALWGVLLDVEDICTDETTSKEQKLKAAHTLATLAGTYLKVSETHDLERRVDALESEVRNARPKN
jgi:hypothetical protein